MDSSESDGDARSDSSDSSHNSSSDSSSELEEEVCVTKSKKVVQAKTQVKKKDNVKVQNKESVCKAEKTKCKSSDQNVKVPKIKKKKACEKDITEETVSTSAIEQSGLQSLTLKEPTGMGAATIAIPADDYRSLIEFVR